MNTQKNIMLIAPISTFVYGVWFLISPESYASLTGAPMEAITPLANTQLGIHGAGLLFLSYVLFWIRSSATNDNIVSAMTIFAAGWLLYGLGIILANLRYPIEGGDSTLHYIEAVIFLILAVIHYFVREPKTN